MTQKINLGFVGSRNICPRGLQGWKTVKMMTALLIWRRMSRSREIYSSPSDGPMGHLLIVMIGRARRGEKDDSL